MKTYRRTRFVIADVLSKIEPKTPKAIAHETGINYENVKRTLRRMENDGSARRVFYGEYVLV